jgi:hypothetical protein
MSAEISLPLPRTDALPPQPVEVVAVDSDVALGCSGCDAELRLPLEPLKPMLDAVSEFVHRHGPCQ